MLSRMTVQCALSVQAPEDSTGRQRAPVNWQPVLAAMALSPKQMRAAHEARLALGELPLQIAKSSMCSHPRQQM
jgi:hypothetical protein